MKCPMSGGVDDISKAKLKRNAPKLQKAIKKKKPTYNNDYGLDQILTLLAGIGISRHIYDGS